MTDSVPYMTIAGDTPSGLHCFLHAIRKRIVEHLETNTFDTSFINVNAYAEMFEDDYPVATHDNLIGLTDSLDKLLIEIALLEYNGDNGLMVEKWTHFCQRCHEAIKDEALFLASQYFENVDDPYAPSAHVIRSARSLSEELAIGKDILNNVNTLRDISDIAFKVMVN